MKSFSHAYGTLLLHVLDTLPASNLLFLFAWAVISPVSGAGEVSCRREYPAIYFRRLETSRQAISTLMCHVRPNDGARLPTLAIFVLLPKDAASKTLGLLQNVTQRG